MPFLAFLLTLVAAIQGGSAYQISGEVHDFQGKPISGITVSASSINVRGVSAGTKSDANGRFVLTLPTGGTYRLLYKESGYIPQHLPFFQDPTNQPPQVTLNDQAPSAQVNILIKKNGVLTGQAIDAQTLLPIDNLMFLMCHAENRSTCWRMSAKSADGIFTIPTSFVPFKLRVISPNYEDWLGLTGGETEPLSVPAETQTSLRLMMRRKPAAVNLPLNEAEKRAGINLPAPNQLSPIDNQVFDIYPRVTRLAWAPVEGAASYTVEIDYCDGFGRKRQCIDPQPLNIPANPPSSKLTTTSYEFRFIGAQPGRWRVWAIDRDGGEGFKSAWRTFVYLR